MVCKYLSHPINSLFTLLVVSFALRKFFSLMQSHLSAFAFLACSVVTYPWFHTWLDQCCKVFPASVFFLEFCSLRVLLCIFNLLWVDLCMWSEKGPISFLYIWMSSFPAPSVERLPFPPYVFLAPLLKISWPIDTHRFISGPLVLFLWSVSAFMSILCCFDYSSFVISLKSGNVRPLTLFLIFQDCFVYSVFIEMPIWILGWIFLFL